MGYPEKLQRSVCASRARLQQPEVGGIPETFSRHDSGPGAGVERCRSSPELTQASRIYGSTHLLPRKRKPSNTRPSSASKLDQARRQSTPSGGHGTASRPSSAGHVRPATAERATETPLVAYLRLFGLTQYASAFADAGLADFAAIARLSENQELDFLESIQVYPGQRAKLLRAIESLRHATLLGSSRVESKEAAIVERLCERNDVLALEKNEAQAQNQILQEENHHLFIKVREQASANRQQAELLKSNQDRVAELEHAVWQQTEQVSFLALQLQRVMERDQSRSSDRAAARAMSSTAPAQPVATKKAARDTSGLDHKPVTDCLQGGAMGEDAVRCLSSWLHRCIEHNAAAGARRQRVRHDVNLDNSAFNIFMEPQCSGHAKSSSGTYENTFEEPDSPTLQHSVSGSEREMLSPGSPFAPLQPVPSKWEIAGIVAETMQIFQMQPEVSVLATIYMQRFCDRTGSSIGVDNWRRLIFISLILASKVWDELPFDSDEVAQISPTYSLDELRSLERVFVQAIEFDLSVHDEEYSKARHLLCTMESKSSDAGNPSPPSLDAERAAMLQKRCQAEQLSLKEKYLIRRKLAAG